MMMGCDGEVDGWCDRVGDDGVLPRGGGQQV